MSAKLILSVTAAAAIILGGWPERALCADSAANEELSRAVDTMDDWLGTGLNAQRWRRYLKLRLLRNELVAEEAADPAVVRVVLDRFSGSAPGLEMPKFVAVRRAVQAWLDELVSESDKDVPAAIEATKQQFALVTAQDVQKAKAELRRLVERLDRYLGTSENGLAWKRYLRWEDLSAQMADDARTNRQLLESVHHRFGAGDEGLDLPVFADVRQALLTYIQKVWSAGDEDPKLWYAERMELLSKIVDAVQRQSKREDLQTLGAALGGLERRGYSRGLIGALRRRHSRPNLMLQASAELLGAGMVEPVDETQPVTDLILGTNISGTGHTQGTVHIELVPSTRRATFEAVFEGAIRTRTVGRNGPARIGSRGVTRIVGRKRLTFDAQGLASTSTRSSAQTDTTTTGIWSTRCGMVDRIIRRVASRRLARDKSLAERIAASHAEEQFNDRMDERVAQLAAEANQSFLDKFRRPLFERDEFPRLLRFHTSGDFLHLTALQANGYQLGAPDAPPPLIAEADLAVRLHESLLNNFAAALLSGETIEEDEFLADIESLFGSVPERFLPEEGTEPWIITFQPVRPIIVQFEGGAISITIRGRRYASGERIVPRGFDVTARYRLERTDSGLKAIRSEDLRVFPAGFDPAKRTLSLREQNWRELLERRFENIFEEELAFEHLTLPGRWEEAGELIPVQVGCDDGWLVLSWRLARAADAADVAQAGRSSEQLATAAAEK